MITTVQDEKTTEAFLKAAAEGNVDEVKRLLKEGVDANASNERGNTALHKAVRKGQTAIVEELLKSGSNINIDAQDTDNRTPLYVAVSHLIDLQISKAITKSTREEDTRKMIKLLLEKGADPTIADSTGDTPESLARSANLFAVIEELRKASAQFTKSR